MNKIKFSVVGCGNIGKRHIAVIDSQENAELVAICDIDEQKCKEQSALYEVPYYLDYDELLKNIKSDVISICTPHGLHCEMSIKASQTKTHSLVEKPMALTVSDCIKMMNAAQKQQVKLFVVKQNRFNKPIALAKDALDSRKLGKIWMVQCSVLWNRHRGYYADSDWRGKKSLEGGSLYTQVSHFIDLLIWWFGELTESKTMTSTLFHDIEIEDCGIAALKFKSGVLGSLTWTTCVYNKNYEGSITIIGEKGTIKIGGKYLNKIEFWDVKSFPLPDDIEFEDKPNEYGQYQGSSSNHDKVVFAITQKLLNERIDVVEGDEGTKSIEAIEFIYSNQ